MTAVLTVALVAAVLVGTAVNLWYRRQLRTVEAARSVEKALRVKAQDDARVAATIADHQARVANAMYVRLREEDRREVDEIMAARDTRRAADFLRRSWNRARRGSNGGGVPGTPVPGAPAEPADRSD